MSRSALDDKIFEEGVATRKTVQEAQSSLDQATSAQYSLDNLNATLGRNVTNAQQRAMEAENQRNLARDAYNAAKADPTTTEEQLAAAKGRRDWAQQQHANARAGLKKHTDRAANPDQVRDPRFADRVPSCRACGAADNVNESCYRVPLAPVLGKLNAVGVRPRACSARDASPPTGSSTPRSSPTSS
jgi:hypothetical protein